MLAEQIIKLEKAPEQMKELSQKAYDLALTYNWNTTITKTINYLINNKEKNNVQK